MALPHPRYHSPREYLLAERESEIKHEYLDGEVFAMAGASESHNIITGNTYAALHSQLRKRPCNVYPSDMRVRTPDSGLYSYPDISVVCGDTQIDREIGDTLLNPTVIIEILSPTTERFDKGKKLQHYRRIPSLQAYLLIAQDIAQVEMYLRQGDQWIYSDFTAFDAVINLPMIGCTLTLSDIYEKVILLTDKGTDT
ncbi:MAG TPA: Uma2 family endonuclease [Aggregatilineales bacterium]|nr:Uma2 family endonuclease [Aggregatilineales bacterium]